MVVVQKDVMKFLKIIWFLFYKDKENRTASYFVLNINFNVNIIDKMNVRLTTITKPSRNAGNTENTFKFFAVGV